MTDVAATIIQAEKTKLEGRRFRWRITARIVRVANAPQLPADQEVWISIHNLVGVVVELSYEGPILPNMSLRSGILFRLTLTPAEVEEALDGTVGGGIPLLKVRPEVIRPMDEPCVRVPLSILKELRGQEAGIEYARRALVQTWAEDRRTGAASSKQS